MRSTSFYPYIHIILSICTHHSIHIYTSFYPYIHIQVLLASDAVDLNPTDTEMEDGYTPLQLSRQLKVMIIIVYWYLFSTVTKLDCKG